MNDMLYWVACSVFRVLMSVAFRVRVEGIENIPAGGAAIICSNHVSWWDPPLIAVAATRKVHFMAKEELFKYPILGFIMPRVRAFPVRRGRSDRSAIRRAVGVLESGGVLGLFPEGTRQTSGRLADFTNGAAYLAMKSGAPIVPAAVRGDYRLFSEVFVRFGKPVHHEEVALEEPGGRHRALSDLTHRLRDAIGELFDD